MLSIKLNFFILMAIAMFILLSSLPSPVFIFSKVQDKFHYRSLKRKYNHGRI
ncbi:MAG: hypothetical protein ABRQ37_27155 [Candidatus Eremiobacterota bacterium]